MLDRSVRFEAERGLTHGNPVVSHTRITATGRV